MNTEHTCDWCSEVLQGQEYSVRAYHYAELKVAVKIWYHLCNACYEQVRSAVKQTRTKIRKQKLQELWASYNQLLQPAVKI
jgi:hypothetical protein